MIARCENPKARHFKSYGGRGIKVCARWRESFEAFLADMGRRPSTEHSIDRIDNDGDYAPLNCRWLIEADQHRNMSTNTHVVVDGQRMILKDACSQLGRKYRTIVDRIYRGWTPQEALGLVPRERR